MRGQRRWRQWLWLQRQQCRVRFRQAGLPGGRGRGAGQCSTPGLLPMCQLARAPVPSGTVRHLAAGRATHQVLVVRNWLPQIPPWQALYTPVLLLQVLLRVLLLQMLPQLWMLRVLLELLPPPVLLLQLRMLSLLLVLLWVQGVPPVGGRYGGEHEVEVMAHMQGGLA